MMLTGYFKGKRRQSTKAHLYETKTIKTKSESSELAEKLSGSEEGRRR